MRDCVDAKSAAVALPPVLARTIEATDTPPIPAARAWALRYGGAAGPAIDMTQAVPGYPPHPELLARLAAAAGSSAAAGYGPLLGDDALRESLAADIAKRYGASLSAGDIAITAVCNLAFVMAMEAIAAPGDAVLLPAPWYLNHRMALTLRGVEPVPLPCEAARGFVPDPVEAARRVSPRTRAIVLVTPNNPTGAAYPPETLARLAALARSRGLWLVIDETYRDFLPGEGPPHALFAKSDWRDHLIHLHSFAKAHGVPGHRVGAVAAGQRFLDAFVKAADTLQICAPRAAQAALADAPHWRVDALGGHFAHVRIPDRMPDAVTVAERLACERGLLVLPGPFFGPGQERHLRFAFANAGEGAIAAVPARLAGLAG